jgi:hypothetical protein
LRFRIKEIQLHKLSDESLVREPHHDNIKKFEN